jgi:hypothetical protein
VTGQSYHYQIDTSPLDTIPPYVTGAETRLQGLFDASYTTALNTVGGSNALDSAAFQLALWEVIYDDDLDLTTGSFSVANLPDSNLMTTSQGFIDAIGNPGETQWNLTFFDGTPSDPDAQDVVTATAIPLPAAAWLLLAASGGLIVAKRRRANKA